MNEMTLKFSENDVGINIVKFMNNRQIDTKFRKMFSLLRTNEDGIITIDQFIEVLEKNHWKITHRNLKPEYENVDPQKYTDYIFKSKNNQSKLHLFFTNKYNIPEYKANYDNALNRLLDLSKNAIIINDNVTDFNRINNQFNNSIEPMQPEKDYTHNMQLIKGKMYKPSIRKALKTKKGKIILCTIIGFTIVAGSFIAHTVSERLEAQKVIEQNKQYSYQVDQSSDNINQEREMYQAIQDGTIDDSLASPNKELEEIKIEQNQQYYNEQNYQRLR